MGITLLFIICVTWAAHLAARQQLNSVTVGLIGLTVYSIPAVFRLTYPFEFNLPTTQAFLVQSDPTATLVMIYVWISIAIFSIFIDFGRRPRTRQAHTYGRIQPMASERQLLLFEKSLLMFSLVGWAVLIYQDGLTYFLADRDLQNEGIVKSLWRWTNVFGVLIAFHHRRYWAILFYVFSMLTYFVAGDRTIIVILAFASLVYFGQRTTAIVFFTKPTVILSVCMLGLIVVFGKNFYLAIKSGSLDILVASITDTSFEKVLLTLEPFGTFNILNIVTTREVDLDFFDFIKNAFAQFLIVPSYFGFYSNSFSELISQGYGAGVKFGIAGNFWAQAWAVGGIAGTTTFALFYIGALKYCDRVIQNENSNYRFLAIALAGLISVYAHRNSFENLLAFVRQILIVFVPIYLLSKGFAPFLSNQLPLKKKTK
jgi:hypothetical protein